MELPRVARLAVGLALSSIVVAEDVRAADDDVPRYFVIPIHGLIGRQVGAEPVEKAMRTGLKEPDTVLVLDIDSPGGRIRECEKIVDVLAEEKGRRSIAYVRSALSAAAIVALTCDEIYMHRDATIGSATAIRKTAKGVEAVEEKFQSAWRSMCRHAAEVGGHDPLYAEAMMDAAMQVRFVDAGGVKKLESVLKPTPEDLSTKRMVSVKGKLLNATAVEATRIGLAQGVVDDFESVPFVAEGLADWEPVSSSGVNLMRQFARRVKSTGDQIDKAMEKAQKALDLASRCDPTRQEYLVEAGGRFTDESRAKWVRYTKKCFAYLTECEKSLSRAVRYAKKYDVFESELQIIEEHKKAIRKIREEVARGVKRQGV